MYTVGLVSVATALLTKEDCLTGGIWEDVTCTDQTGFGCEDDILVPEVDFIGDGKIAFYGKNIPMRQKKKECIKPCGVEQGSAVNCQTRGSHVKTPSCYQIDALQEYGMDGDWIIATRTEDDYGIPYKYGSRRQCALCPVVDTCKEQCDHNRYSDECLQCLSPEGRYRCQIDNKHCDKPGYVWVTTRRSNGRLSTHCVKTDKDPEEEDEWHTTNLQKNTDRKEPFFPHRWQNGIHGTSATNHLTPDITCQSGYVPVRQSKDNLGMGTCSGYVCERCPNTYIEVDQICKKCGERGGWVGHLLGADYNDNECYKISVPIGAF